ncbi:hypothetical protein ACSLVK_20185 [Photorhabdus tasmaniensis]
MPTYKNQEKTNKSWLKDNSQRLLAYNQLPREDDSLVRLKSPYPMHHNLG